MKKTSFVVLLILAVAFILELYLFRSEGNHGPKYKYVEQQKYEYEIKKEQHTSSEIEQDRSKENLIETKRANPSIIDTVLADLNMDWIYEFIVRTTDGYCIDGDFTHLTCSGKLQIVDMVGGDKSKEVMVSKQYHRGYLNYIYRYTDNTLKLLGRVYSESDNIIFDGRGNIVWLKGIRTGVRKEYYISHRLEKDTLIKAYYNDNIHTIINKVKCLKNIYMSRSDTLFSTDIKVDSSSMVDLSYDFTRNIVEVAHGQSTCYIYIEDNSMIRHSGYRFAEVFPGFFDNVLKEDMDGDGYLEIISILSGSDQFNSEDMYTVFLDGYLLTENGVNSPEFEIVDIDPDDGLKELAIGERGPSSDPNTKFFAVENDTLVQIGWIYSMIGKWGIEIIAPNLIETRTRGSVLHTWFYQKQYRLNDKHRLEPVPKDLYEMNAKLTMINKLHLQKSRTDSTLVIILQKGEKVVLSKTDDERWCLVENSKGQKGWFEIDGYDTIVSTGKSAREYFKGLCYAD